MKTTYVMKNLIEELKQDPIIKAADKTAVIIGEICSKIQKEENSKLDPLDVDYLEKHGPSGSHVYLTLWIPPLRTPKEFSCLTMEYDALTGWSVCYYYDFGRTNTFIMKKRHDIKGDNPNMVMTEFGKIYKAYLGKNEINP